MVVVCCFVCWFRRRGRRAAACVAGVRAGVSFLLSLSKSQRSTFNYNSQLNSHRTETNQTMASSSRHPSHTTSQTNPFDDEDDSQSWQPIINPSSNNNISPPKNDPRLSHYENLLSSQIESDFFSPNFNALPRVIDILGVSLQNTSGSGFNNNSTGGNNDYSYANNHAYATLTRQQSLVEEAIEYMAVRHCADLNLSVSAVGRMSRQFDEARCMVENLRVQVGSVGDSLRLGEVGGGLVSIYML